MKRRWIPLDRIEIYDEMHFKTEDGWDVDVEKDGCTKAEHVAGIDYIKSQIQKAVKIRPILVVEEDEGVYRRLDGFKRCIAHMELGEQFIEAFVCSWDECHRQDRVKYLHGEMWAGKGGQMKEVYTSVAEGYEKEGDFDYEKVEFLFKNETKPHGLKIEACESIHIHWGEYGKYRFGVGRKDFEQLAKAISSIE
jgi:hypothetical protein